MPHSIHHRSSSVHRCLDLGPAWRIDNGSSSRLCWAAAPGLIGNCMFTFEDWNTCSFSASRSTALSWLSRCHCAELCRFNQGDTYVGNVPRADVAAVCSLAAGFCQLLVLIGPWLHRVCVVGFLVCDVPCQGAVAATDPLNSGAGKTFEMFKALDAIVWVWALVRTLASCGWFSFSSLIDHVDRRGRLPSFYVATAGWQKQTKIRLCERPALGSRSCRGIVERLDPWL